MNLQREKILANLSIDDFIGRSLETDALLRYAKGENITNGLLVLSAPCTGVSELLRQTYDQLFYEQGEIIPFYFALRKSDKTARIKVAPKSIPITKLSLPLNCNITGRRPPLDSPTPTYLTNYSFKILICLTLKWIAVHLFS